MKRCSVKPYEGSEKYIFVSYCHKDRRFVFPVIEYLNKAGYRVWFDEGIDPGTEWPEVIANHLNACAACVAFISENSVQSHNCRREINFALMKGKPFLSVFLEEVRLSVGMEMQLSTMQSILGFTYNQRTDRFNAITSTPILRPCLGTPDPNVVISDDSEYDGIDGDLFSSNDEANSSIIEVNSSLIEVNGNIIEVARPYAETTPIEVENEKDEESNESDENDGNEVDGDNEEDTVIMDRYTLLKKGSGEKVEIDKDVFTIGRINCDYTIRDNSKISRKHATIMLKDGRCFVVDNGSKNKTFVNGEAIEPNVEVEVREYDEIAFYDVCFVLETLASEFDSLVEQANNPANNQAVILFRKHTNEEIPINKGVFRIGKKQATCDYIISNNTSISRNHADIVLRDGKCLIVDNGSTNKTFVNKSEIPPKKEVLLNHGDEVKLGNVCFVVKIK